jgi:hypothetical protein
MSIREEGNIVKYIEEGKAEGKCEDGIRMRNCNFSEFSELHIKEI